SAEVWQILGGVKAQFGKFGDLLEGVQKKLTESANKIESAKTTSRQIERKLKDVETISEGENLKLLDD
ncbi:DNA recombination protein RmuC, partial [Candidatus Saccharibacteria bacterium]|nr:DNA recombination protein RmuC [Candidatus Saccharibacteria bacterium]